ncbi:MAG: AAA family ATPase [Candidatus Coprovivens sp.]
MKIYVIGPTGSGKTTLSESLSKKYKIKCYELDLLVYDDENGHIKRKDEVREKMFQEILKKKSWIIEDVGRSKFEEGRKQADIIYYINIPKIVVYKRVITRWIKQRLGKERYNYPPTLWQLYDMLRTTKGYFKKEKEKKKSLEKYQDKVKYLSYKELNKLEK